jgi:hypothetical protein
VHHIFFFADISDLLRTRKKGEEQVIEYDTPENDLWEQRRTDKTERDRIN